MSAIAALVGCIRSSGSVIHLLSPVNYWDGDRCFSSDAASSCESVEGAIVLEEKGRSLFKPLNSDRPISII